jgi:hypothetical protein
MHHPTGFEFPLLKPKSVVVQCESPCGWLMEEAVLINKRSGELTCC